MKYSVKIIAEITIHNVDAKNAVDAIQMVNFNYDVRDMRITRYVVDDHSGKLPYIEDVRP